MRSTILLFVALAGCAEPPSEIQVSCDRTPASDGIVINCGDENVNTNTDEASSSETDPFCMDANDCRAMPMICDAYLHCLGGICLCNTIKLSKPECEQIEDCPPPLEEHPNCSRRSCWAGECGFHPYTADGSTPCFPDD